MKKLKIVKVYHDEKLKDSYSLNDDEIRKCYNTQNNEWGRYLNEFTALFDEDEDYDYEYIGLEHYRRTFVTLNRLNYNLYLNALPEKYAYIYEAYSSPEASLPYLNVLNLQKWKNQLAVYFREHNMLKELECLDAGITIWRSMFIMKKEYFDEYRKFIIDIKDYLFKVNNIKSPDDIVEESKDVKIGMYLQNWRLYAYIFEYLTDIWIRCNMEGYMLLRHAKI